MTNHGYLHYHRGCDWVSVATFMTTKTILTSCAAALVFAALPQDAQAGERRFAYTYEVTTSPKNSVEFENWVTWKARRGSDKTDRFDFRHELEIGLTDSLQLGLYLSDWRVERKGGHTEADWRNFGGELIWNLSNPTTDFLGSALYGEVKAGDELFVLEGKLLLQKNFGPWIVAYNAIFEAEWEGVDLEEQVGVFEQTLGISYQVTPSFTVGAEVLHEVEFAEYEEAGDHVVYVGPNASYRFGKCFATATVLFETTGVEGEFDVQSRLIFGFSF